MNKTVTEEINGLRLERATEKHLEVVFSWVNDVQTRANSFDSSPIAIEAHTAWFKKKITDPAVYYFICYAENEAIGQVRFDQTEADNYLISFGVAPEARGRGWGKRVLESGILTIESRISRPNIMTGYVKKENTASARIFEKLNFYKSDATEYPAAYKYTLQFK